MAYLLVLLFGLIDQPVCSLCLLAWLRTDCCMVVIKRLGCSSLQSCATSEQLHFYLEVV